MTRTEAIREIMKRLNCGLPKAISKYNWISAYGELEVTKDMIERWC